ncbi:MAG: HDOD domain-containing protein [Deltaproteobacteria bacterium]|nr:HDOD domain-containing protein [Deltaproteobacteria bacterium]
MESIDITRQRARIENITALPTVPETLKKTSQVIGKPRVTLDEISHFISSDPALTTKVLRMVNSAVYGFPGRISSVSHAIMLLGLNVVRGLLLGISVFDIMQKLMTGLWDHSLGCAMIARAVAEKKGVKAPEEVAIAALLHDIGKVILILEFQPLYEGAMREAASRRIPIFEAERGVFQETHAAVGMWLAEKWRFPVNLVEGIGYHHRPNMAKTAPLETAIVHFSDVLMRARGFGFAGDSLAAAVHPAAFELLALTEADMLELLDKLENSLDESGGLTL